MARYFKPWKGKLYKAGGVLILSESTYKWTGDYGQLYTPTPDHVQEGVPLSIEKFGANKGYFNSLNRSLSSKSHPTSEELTSIWEELSYCAFVQEPLEDRHHRPKRSQWVEAGLDFLALIEELRPSKVVVTGKSMWHEMPECSVRLLDDLQAYRLDDGTLVWCLALPHPSNKTEGFRWERVGESIRAFRRSQFPSRWDLHINADYST